MAHIHKSELFGISASYNDERLGPAYPGIAQSIGAAIAFVVVIIGWAVSKLSGRDLLD